MKLLQRKRNYVIMNKHIARFYTSVIKNEIKRKKIYNILTNSIADNISLDDIDTKRNSP